MALIIYLDTQDYINIFNESEDGPSKKVLKDLLSYRDNGDIVIGFSFATILEFITKPNAENRSERVRRGQLIKDICGPNAFPYLTDLARGAKFPNEGRWLHFGREKIISAKAIRLSMEKACASELSKTPNLTRKERRKFQTRSGMKELLRTTGSNWGRKRSDYGELPVSDEFIESRVFERFMKGQCSDTELEQKLNAWASDPAEFSRIAFDYGDSPDLIKTHFGAALESIESSAVGIQDVLEQQRKLNSAQLARRVALKESGMDEAEAKNLTKQLALPDVDFTNITERLEAAFGKRYVGHFSHYIAQVMRHGYTFKRSDLMDVMQMCYAYDCDFFRCDKAMAHTFRNFEPFKGKLVARFAELPERIAGRLGA